MLTQKKMSGKKQVKQYYQSGAVRDCIVEEMPKDGKKPSHLTELATEDPCPVCDADLYLNVDFTKRIAVTKEDTVVGWICPDCWSEFTMEDKVLELYTRNQLKARS